jgi:hypothetical protein
MRVIVQSAFRILLNLGFYLQTTAFHESTEDYSFDLYHEIEGMKGVNTLSGGVKCFPRHARSTSYLLSRNGLPSARPARLDDD